MQVAFILKLDLPNTNDLAAISESISESVSEDGHQVISCVPWQRNDIDPGSIAMAQTGMGQEQPEQPQGPMDLTSFGL